MKKVEYACNPLMDKGAQGYIDLSDLDLTSCHLKDDVILKMPFLSSNLQHVTFECKKTGDCNFTTAIVDGVIFRCRHLHNIIFIKAGGGCVDFSKNILSIVDFSQSQLAQSNFREYQIRNSNFDSCYLYASHFIRAEFLPAKEISFIKSDMTAVVFDHVRISTGNFKDCITEQLELAIDYSDIFGSENLDGCINNIIKTIGTLSDNAMILKSVLAAKLATQLKILNIVNKNFIENMKKTFSHCLYIKDPITRSYIHSGEDNKFDDFMRQRRFNRVDFGTQQMIHFINRSNMNRGLIDKNSNFFIQLIGQALQSTDDMIKANAWYLYKEWIRSDGVSSIFIETEEKLRAFNTNKLTWNSSVFILFSSVDNGPVMMVSSQRLRDMLSPTKDINWNSMYICKSRHEMLPVNLTQETLFSSKSQDKRALFPTPTASWRVHRIMNKGVQVKENITVPGILGGDTPTVAPSGAGIGKAQGSTAFYHFVRLLRFCCVLDHLICFTPPVNAFLRYNAFTLCNGEFDISHPALMQLRALRYFKEIPALGP